MNYDDVIDFVPDAPNFADAAKMMSKGMDAHPEQAAQILAGIGALKNRKDGYGAYVSLATQLDVEPVTQAEFDEHNKRILIPLIRSALMKNFPKTSVSDGDIDEVLEACEIKEKTLAARRIVTILLKILGASSDQVQPWTKLALAGLSLA